MNFVNLIKKAATTIARMNPFWVIVYCTAIGGMIVLGSFAKEAVFENNLLLTQGGAALDAYKALVAAHRASNLHEYLVWSFSGEMPSATAFIRGIGYLVAFVISPAAAAVVLVANIIRLAMFNTRTARAV